MFQINTTRPRSTASARRPSSSTTTGAHVDVAASSISAAPSASPGRPTARCRSRSRTPTWRSASPASRCSPSAEARRSRSAPRPASTCSPSRSAASPCSARSGSPRQLRERQSGRRPVPHRRPRHPDRRAAVSDGTEMTTIDVSFIDPSGGGLDLSGAPGSTGSADAGSVPTRSRSSPSYSTARRSRGWSSTPRTRAGRRRARDVPVHGQRVPDRTDRDGDGQLPPRRSPERLGHREPRLDRPVLPGRPRP